MVIEGHAIFAGAKGIVDSAVGVPNLRAIDLAGVSCGVPLEPGPALAFVDLCQRVILRVWDLLALDFAAGVRFIPGEAADAGARNECGVSPGDGVLDSCAISRALFDLVDPEIVDGAAAGVVDLSGGV